jgi:HEPN domain-containing protein
VTARLWLRGAEADLALATQIAQGFPARAVFHSQQSAEMALKAILVAVAGDHPSTHALCYFVRALRASPMRSTTLLYFF